MARQDDVSTHVEAFRRAFALNSTASSYDAAGIVAGEPVSSVTRFVMDLGNFTANNLLFGTFFGANAANEVFLCRISGSRRMWNAKSGVADLWNTYPMYELTITLGTATGINGTDFEDENFLADTLVMSATITIGNPAVCSPADNTQGSVAVDMFGAEKAVIDMKTSTSLNCNGMFGKL